MLVACRLAGLSDLRLTMQGLEPARNAGSWIETSDVDGAGFSLWDEAP